MQHQLDLVAVTRAVIAVDLEHCVALPINTRGKLAANQINANRPASVGAASAANFADKSAPTVDITQSHALRFADYRRQPAQPLAQALWRHVAEVQSQVAWVGVRIDEERLARHEGDVLRQRRVEQRAGVERLLQGQPEEQATPVSYTHLDVYKRQGP